MSLHRDFFVYGSWSLLDVAGSFYGNPIYCHCMDKAKKHIVIPDFIEPLIAYRQWNWRLRDGAAELTPIAHHGQIWLPGKKTEALCSRNVHMKSTACPHCGELIDPHPPPQSGCSCGLYGFKDPVAFMRQLPAVNRLHVSYRSTWPRSTPPHDTMISGAVHLWGRVIEHKSGYRAQFGYPALLCHRSERILEQLEKSYPGVELFEGSFADMIAKHFKDPEPPTEPDYSPLTF
jgi:hypothetical protein